MSEVEFEYLLDAVRTAVAPSRGGLDGGPLADLQHAAARRQ